MGHKVSYLKHSLFLFVLFLIVSPSLAFAASSSGYSEFYVPGDEDDLIIALEAIGNGSQGLDTHAVIGITTWSANTVVYYDHWEDGYDFDYNNPAISADETFTLAVAGDHLVLEDGNITTPRSSNIPDPQCTGVSGYCYDGRDRIIVAGGTATVSRASWSEASSTNLSVAWEVYPVSPQLTHYILPFGEDIGGDFDRVFTLIMATEDGTRVTVDYTGDGNPDPLNINRAGGYETSYVDLNKGESFLLDNVSINDTTTTFTLDTGTEIQGTQTLQVQYIIGDEGSQYEIRGLSAFPRGFWDDEYYAPVDRGHITNGGGTEIYLHNPHNSDLTIDYQSSDVTLGNGQFTISAGQTIAFSAVAPIPIPVGTAVYFKGSDVFWGVSTIDKEQVGYDWAYSLVPALLLENEHFMGWAPSTRPITVGDYDASGLFIASAQDNTHIFIDRDGDGASDEDFILNRLQTHYAFDPDDGDMSGARIWATGPFTLAYGQNPAYAPYATPAIDVGYTSLPGNSFIDIVLDIEKTADPVVVPTAAGSQSTYTLTVNSGDYSVDGISISDFLPSGWQYVDDSTTITLADLSVISGNAADPNFVLYADSFGTVTYGNNADNQPAGTNWTTNWIEENDDGTATGGNIQVQSDTGVTPNVNALWFGDSNGTNRYIARIADLTGHDQVQLSFDYRRSNLDSGGDSVIVQICEDANNATPITCNGSWTNIYDIDGSVTGTDAEYQHYQVDLTTLGINPNSSTFALRFDSDDLEATNDRVYIRNVQLAAALSWPSSLLGNMSANQQIIIEFTAETTRDFALGDVTQNIATASGTRTVGTVTQTFNTSDSAFNSFGDMEVTKASSGIDPLYPGDQFTYTVTVTNPPAATAPLTGVAIYDPLPAGVSYVAGSSYVDLSAFSGVTYLYDFESGAQGFTVGAADGDVLPTNWELGDPTSFAPATSSSNCNSGTQCYGGGPEDDHTPTGVNCWGTDLDALYSNNIGGIYLYSPIYDFTGYANIQLSFWEWMEIEGNNYDYSHLQYSINGGAWTDAVLYGDTEPSRVDTSWSQSNYDASGYAANQPSVQWRWMIDSDVSWQWGGWYIDDVVVQAASSSPPYPGPVNDPPNFVQASDGYSLAPGQTLTLTYDVTIDDPLASGITSITNVASVNSNEITLPSYAEVTNIVVNPSAAMATVGELIWLDSDGDGIKDVGEPGLSGVEITLRDQFGTPVAVTTTDITGQYQFAGVPAGTGYYVEVTAGLPTGVSQSAPTGRSDDRSDSFTLTSGQNYTGANLGYAPDPTTATFGNLVWSDADGNGIRDAGEPGLGGVTIEIYLDDGDGIFNPALDTPSGTTTSAADGSYLFTGIAATGIEIYFVYVNESQAALSGYTVSTGASSLNSNVNGGDVLLNNDFGFQPNAGTGYTIQDRIWFDADGDGSVGPTETGIAGVTVDLLDASGNIITTATTDSNGDVIFSGVPAGANYTIKVTDTAGILTNYYGTTTDALAGERTIVNLSADESGNANFGYNLTSTIGDTVFNDLNGNGTQDAGENGISGVQVTLFDTSYNQLATLTTDSNGQYLFTGLADGNYIISVENGDEPSGYNFTGTDADAGRAGAQLTATLAGGNTVLGTDFGYRAPTPQTISGTLWDDLNSDGVIDPGESGLAGVTVNLERGGVVVATATTDATGAYSFPGLVSDTYTVVVTDTSGVLSGYDITYEKTEGTTPPFNGQESVVVAGVDQTDIHFGFNKPVPTLAVIFSFRAFDESGRMVIEWQTASEVGTVGFYLQRFDRKTRRFVNVNNELLPGLLHSPQGGIYQYVDEGVAPGSHIYRLMEVEMGGGERLYGPYNVNPVASSLPTAGQGGTIKTLTVSSADRLSGISTKMQNYTRTPHMLKQPRKQALAVKPMTRYRPGGKRLRGTSLDFSTQARGLHFIPAVDIAAGFDRPENRILRRIKKGRLQLTSQGQVVKTWPGETGLYFIAEDIDSIYTNDNKYRLSLRKNKLPNKRIISRPFSVSAQVVPVENLTYRETVHSEKDNWALTALFDDPEADYWLWDYVFVGYGSTSFSAASPGVSADGQAELTVYFQGATDSTSNKDHHAVIKINGYNAGETVWDGAVAHSVTFKIDQWQLNDGDNTVEIAGILGPGVPNSLFYVDSINVRYDRTYRAVDNELYCRGDANTSITVDNFTTPDIQVFDISNPALPERLQDVFIDEVAGTFRASFIPLSPESEYLVTTYGSAVTVADIHRDKPSFLKTRRKAADYVIITPAEFMASAEQLAAFRELQGLRSMIVDIEDIYDEFSYGIATPHAIHDFLKYAYMQWKIPPRYIVLAGNGTYDYKNNRRFGDNIIPPVMIATENGLFASDTYLADVKGRDGVPEMAIGRIPASDAAEFAVFVNKMIDYESSSAGSWMRKVTLLADNPDEGGNFSEDSDHIATLVPSDYQTEKIYLADQTLAGARTQLFDSLNQGALIVNYIGHAGLDRLASEGLLISDDVPNLLNAERLPFMAAMTCIAGRFEIPGFDTLAKKLLLKESGGINGLWSATGYSYNALAVQLNSHLFKELLSGGQKRIGDGVRNALADQYNSLSGYDELLDIYNLLGDPAMLLH